ncbi:variable surface protein [Plasmodium gonderi]|uniref:Variable surface protein n=1 Tax=Plasmodium gonderi TaxID=77519 RepID=A0A1Y1JW16_PLAGO|nr:variable surface protein [Plasmodium gonderi]GAW84074.1 variable surface protein [Plasmodium gonderi]
MLKDIKLSNRIMQIKTLDARYHNKIYYINFENFILIYNIIKTICINISISFFVYLYVNLFDEKKSHYEEYIQISNNDILKENCIKVQLQSIGIDVFFETCPKIINCLYDPEETDERIKDEACISLFYWTYDKYYKDKTEYDNIKKHYHGFLHAYNNYTVSICDYFKENLTEIVLKKLKDIYDMNTELNKIKTNNAPNISDKIACAKKCGNIHKKYENMCKSNDDKIFCTELNKLTTEYNTKTKNIFCENNAPGYLPLVQIYNKKAHNYVPIVVALLITLFIFMLYKFEAYILYKSHIYYCDQIIEDVFIINIL